MVSKILGRLVAPLNERPIIRGVLGGLLLGLLAVALSFGFIGGPIFPLLFVGSAVGTAIYLLFPQLPPVGLAVGAMMVAVPAAVVPIPLALAVIEIVVIGLPPTNTIPVVLASLVSFSVVRGLVMVCGGSQEQANANSGLRKEFDHE